MKKKRLLLATSICILSLFTGCAKEGTYSKYVDLGEYKDLKLNIIKSEVTDDMIDEEIETLLEDNATYTEISDRTAQEGDTVNIDYKGTIDGEEFEDGSAEDFDVELGSGYFIEELESALVGLSVGETKEIPVTFSDDYDESVAGKDAVFTVTVNSISEKHIPEYNDEFITSVTDFTTTADYEEDLRASLLESQKTDNLAGAGMDAISLVIENSTFNGYPQEIYDECKETYDATNQMYAEMFGIDVSELSAEEEEEKSAVEELVYEKMVTTTIAEKEKLSVSDEEYSQYLEDNYSDYGYESAEEYEESETKDVIMQEILSSKVQNFLVDHAALTEVSEEDYYSEEDDSDYDSEEDFEDLEEESDVVE